jgi:hypothetical protein
MERRRARLLVVPGGGERTPRKLAREALRVIRGGPGVDVQEAIERSVAAAQETRREIERRIARDLEDRP